MNACFITVKNIMGISSSIAETKDNLPKYIHDAEDGEDICITRHGKAVAMLISVERYKNKFSEVDDGLFNAIMSWREQLSYEGEGEDLLNDDDISLLRAKGPARDFSWD